MRERSAPISLAQRVQARDGARTMPRWLTAAMLLATAADAWTPPRNSLLFTPRTTAKHNTTRRIHILGWHLELQENQAIASPYYKECQFYRGRVLYEDQSSATVTECDGQLYGLLQVGNEEFVLQPTRPRSPHVLRRRDVLRAELPTQFNLTGDTAADLELDLQDGSEAVPHVRPRHSAYTDLEYFHEEGLVTRPISGVDKLWLEMVIVADRTVQKFHGRDRVEYYILALMNIVSAIFDDPSLDANITLVIKKLVLYDEKDPVIKVGSARMSLKAVNEWNYKQLTKLPIGSTSWDATIWLTRTQLGGPSGYATVDGICSKVKSSAIDRDEGLTSAFVIAHELGHLLGLHHDGDGNHCVEDSAGNAIMAPIMSSTLRDFSWSPCSRKKFHENANKWWCLHQRSTDGGRELGGAKELSNYVFTMDEQCRFNFGEGYSICTTMSVKSGCRMLWCSHKSRPSFCQSKHLSPLEGTECGVNRRCKHGKCEPVPVIVVAKEEEPVTPKWDEWTAWSKCSADCGYGLRRRSRRCRYKGSISATACEGAGSQVTTCWSGVACAYTRDVRSDLCTRQDRRLIPQIQANESRHCEIWCVGFNGGSSSSYGPLPDGSPCSYDRPFDVCYQGACVKGQCNATDPECNWCPDGYCINNTHAFTRHVGRMWSRMTVIPHDAHQFSVQIQTPIPLKIGIRDRKRDMLELSRHNSRRFEIQEGQDNYLKYDRSAPQNLQIIEADSNVINIKDERYGWEGAVVAAGALVQWNITDTDVYITANSRLHYDLLIMAIPEHPLSGDEQVMVMVTANHSTPAVQTKPLEYRTERGPCSVSCGGGMRVVRPRCAPGVRCARDYYEACNTYSCEFKWSAGAWEHCSATCGAAGVQERQLFCVPAGLTSSSRMELIRHSVSPALCPSEKPSREQTCNRIPCPVYWQEMPWTPCSTTCGRGFSYRPLSCPASDDLLCGPRPRLRRRRCRVRRCPASARTPRACPSADGAQYCEYFAADELQRHCALPPFRKYCCNACRDVANAVRRRKYG